jgi:hypothetical protein
VDDVVPATRPITMLDLLSFPAGYGFLSHIQLLHQLGRGMAGQHLLRHPEALPSGWAARPAPYGSGDRLRSLSSMAIWRSS